MKKLLIVAIALAAGFAFADGDTKTETKKNVKYKKTQEVSFDGSDVDGVVRSPDGAYLLQKRGVKFTPLYKVDQEMENGIVESINYLK